MSRWTEIDKAGWHTDQRRGRGTSSLWDLARKGYKSSTGEKSQFSLTYGIKLFLPIHHTLSFQMNLTNSHMTPTACLCHTLKPFQIPTVLNNHASWSFSPVLCSALFFHFCSTETQARPLQGWKLAVYSPSQFPIPWQVFSMTELCSSQHTTQYPLLTDCQNICFDSPNSKYTMVPLTSLVLTHSKQFSLRKQTTKSRLLLSHLGLPLFLLLDLVVQAWKEATCAEQAGAPGRKQPRTTSTRVSRTPWQLPIMKVSAVPPHLTILPTVPWLKSTALGQVETTPSASFTLLPEPCSWSGSALSEVEHSEKMLVRTSDSHSIQRD